VSNPTINQNSETCLDVLSKYESRIEPDVFVSGTYQHYIVGKSIVSISPQMLVVRRASGCASFNRLKCEEGSVEEEDLLGILRKIYTFDLEPPIPLKSTPVTQRAINILDKCPTEELHKIGVIYVGPNQKNEKEILANQKGSSRYENFLETLGEPCCLKNAKFYTGGLDTESDIDGEKSLRWKDELTQVIFHISTMMPTRDNDELQISKKKHIGNDFVIIVYNESGHEYEFNTISGQFNYINIIVTPLEDDHYHIIIQRKDGLPDIGPCSDGKFFSVENSVLVRILAVRNI
jgi:hypothetical protein